ncbi:response regulator [Ramlibacter sp.]|uniref:response regulator n=1 Tax=Ramlibacter sp. TaxID=1917967 RepID=UPI001845C0C4|nr:response regulator [Ramlibacter sp.]MBA2674766.1 response regulator [Ramlibacter sp.]
MNAGQRTTRAPGTGCVQAELVVRLSHELRTPLNAILGYSELIKRADNLTPRQRDGLGAIESSGLTLLALINDLLDVARIDSEALELHPEPICLPAFVQDVAQAARTVAARAGLRFHLEAAPDLPATVVVDSHRLRQVLLNLVTHAAQCAGGGHLVLRAGSTPCGDDAARLGFEVQDMSGMPDPGPAQPFTPFAPAGQVLALQLSQLLARLMGGELLMAGLPAGGCALRFEFAAPVKRCGVAEVAAPMDVTGYAGPRKRVLVVDDVEMYRYMLCDLLGSLGFEVDQAGNGQECLDRVAAHAPDLILIDLVMPVMDGLQAIQSIRMQPQWKDIAIVAVSGSATEQRQLRTLSAGAQAWIAKPVDPEVLIATLGAQLGLLWMRGDVAAHAVAPLPPAPAAEQLHAFHQLALEGNMRKIRAFADALAAGDAHDRPLADQLRRLAADYQSRALVELAERYLACVPAAA